MRLHLMVVASLLFLLAAGFAACDGGGGEPADVVEDVREGNGDICAPVCSGKECGPDGCGGYCGSCESGYSCNSQGSCQELPQCDMVAKISCDELVQGDTTGRENQLQAYSCDGFAAVGGDIAYVFQAQIDDHIRVVMSNQFANLNVLVTQSPCDPSSCLAMSDQEFELDVDGGKKYYFVVDGDDGQEGPFSFTVKCDSTCQPQCGFFECGDDGCGGVCGVCPEAAPECVDGFCETACVPDCDGLECGTDGCGGECGTCPNETPYCNAGMCDVGCLPDCDGKECGDDGCGGVCGTCPVGFNCAASQCIEGGGAGCEPSDTPGCGGCPCEACVCELDPYCCDNNWDTICVGECTDQCGGCGQVQPCGDGLCDANGGENCLTCAKDCGCAGGSVCVDDVCCELQCEGKECGDNGCGGTCGSCGNGECFDGTCIGAGDYCLELVPSAIDFGTVPVGTFEAKDVLIKNCGTKEISLVTIETLPAGVDNMGFDASSLPSVPTLEAPIVLGPNAGQTLSVVYLPSEPSLLVDGELVPDTAEVHIVAAQAGKEVTLPLTGVALDPDCPVAHLSVVGQVTVPALTTISLDGSQSSSPADEIVDYQWSVEAPDGVLHDLSGVATATADFEASLVGDYVFSLTVKDGAGNSSCVPAKQTVTAVAPAGIYVELFWDTPEDANETDEGPGMGSDLDLHFTHPWSSGPDIDGDGLPDPWFNSPYDCYWYNPSPNWGKLNDAADDPDQVRDDTDGGGPEVVYLAVPEAVSYLVGVHYFGNGDFGTANAHVHVYLDGANGFSYPNVPLQPQDMWEVAFVNWLTQEVTLVEKDGGLKITPDYVSPLFQ